MPRTTWTSAASCSPKRKPARMGAPDAQPWRRDLERSERLPDCSRHCGVASAGNLLSKKIGGLRDAMFCVRVGRTLLLELMWHLAKGINIQKGSRSAARYKCGSI